MKPFIFFVYLIIPLFVISQGDCAYNIDELQFQGNGESIKVGYNEDTAIRLLGKPTSIHPYEYEMNETFGSLYLYEGCKLYFEEGKLYSWVFNDNSIAIGYSGKSLRVGDDISEIAKVFPQCRFIENCSTATISLNHSQYQMECTFIVIKIVNDKITEILRHDC